MDANPDDLDRCNLKGKLTLPLREGEMIDRSSVEFGITRKTNDMPELETAQESPALKRALQNAVSIVAAEKYEPKSIFSNTFYPPSTN
jgi:hypothetical protein